MESALSLHLARCLLITGGLTVSFFSHLPIRLKTTPSLHRFYRRNVWKSVIESFVELNMNYVNDCFFCRYDEEDYNQFAPRDPWADLSAKHSTLPPSNFANKPGGGIFMYFLKTSNFILQFLSFDWLTGNGK